MNANDYHDDDKDVDYENDDAYGIETIEEPPKTNPTTD